MSNSPQKFIAGGQSSSGYPDEQPDPNADHPHGPGEGSPHDHQNNPAQKPGDEPHESGGKD